MGQAQVERFTLLIANKKREMKAKQITVVIINERAIDETTKARRVT
jgi:hypothetical protein